MPKTGGSSLRNAFHQFGCSRLLRVDASDPAATAAALRAGSPADRHRVRAIVGHMPFGSQEVSGWPART